MPVIGVDRDHVGADRPRGKGGGDPDQHLGAGQSPVQQHDLDQSPRADGVAVTGPHGGEPAFAARLRERGGAGQCAGLAGQVSR
jgi:hypothetical protein